MGHLRKPRAIVAPVFPNSCAFVDSEFYFESNSNGRYGAATLSENSCNNYVPALLTLKVLGGIQKCSYVCLNIQNFRMQQQFKIIIFIFSNSLS